MRLQLADGGRRRRRGLADAGDIFGQIIGGITQAAQNPNVQKAAGSVIGTILKPRQTTTGSIPATIPVQRNNELTTIVNQLTGAEATIVKLQSENEKLLAAQSGLTTRGYIYGGVGLVVGVGLGVMFSRMRR